MMTALTLKDLPPPPVDRSGWPWTKQSKPLPARMLNSIQWPRLTIVTPSYNQGKFIEATIRSVLLQGYPNLEYIIIDGGSTDNSVDIIKKYEKHLSYWHSKKDNGQADAINQGLNRSTGEILGWINSDDVYVRGAFCKVVKAFHSHLNCIVVHGNRILINEQGEVTGWFCLPPFDPKARTFNVCSETAFWRRCAMQKVGMLNSNLQFAIDLEFFGRLYKQGKFLKINEYLGCFRCYSENKSSTMAHIGQEEALREWKRLFETEVTTHSSKKNKDFFELIKLSTELIINPILLGIPYTKHRFSKLKKGRLY